MNKAIQLSANSKTLILSVEGMTCAACAARIERVLDKDESVEDVVVNFPLKKAVIELNTEDVNSENYIEKIRSVGYSAQEETQVENSKNFKVVNFVGKNFELFVEMILIHQVYQSLEQFFLILLTLLR